MDSLHISKSYMEVLQGEMNYDCKTYILTERGAKKLCIS